MTTFYKIPTVDLAPLIENPEIGIFEVAAEIRDAYTKVGFAYLINHGISESLMDATFAAAKDFHSQPTAEKLKIKQNKFFRGYMPFDFSILKVSSLGDAIKPNQSEAFILGHEVAENDPDFLAQCNLAGPNQWPEGMPEFKKTILLYRKKTQELAYKMLQVFAVAFGMEKNALKHYFLNPTTFLRLQYYPPQPNFIPEHQYGIAPHTDHGFLTLLAQDETGGLQVRNHEGDWIEAPPMRGSFMLNSGDMLKRMTNDAFISTPHRVINRSGADRYSIPFFFEPDMHAPISSLPQFCTVSSPAKYEPMEYYVHLMKRIRNNYNIGA